MTTKTSPPADLTTRLAEAQRNEAPLRRRVAELEAELSSAISTSNYLVADQAQRDLEPARQELAIAAATTKALAEAVGAIEAKRQAEQRAIADQQRREQMRIQANEAHERGQAALADVQRHLGDLRSGLSDVQVSMAKALAAELVAQQAKQDHNALLAELGDPVPGAIALPYPATDTINRDQVLKAVRDWTP